MLWWDIIYISNIGCVSCCLPEKRNGNVELVRILGLIMVLFRETMLHMSHRIHHSKFATDECLLYHYIISLVLGNQFDKITVPKFIMILRFILSNTIQIND